MTTGVQPVGQLGANPTSRSGVHPHRLAPITPGDHQENSPARRDDLFQHAVELLPRTVQPQSVEVHASVGLDLAPGEPALPCAIQLRRRRRSGGSNNGSGGHFPRGRFRGGR